MNFIGFFNVERGGIYRQDFKKTIVFIGFDHIEQVKKYITYTFLNTIRKECPYHQQILALTLDHVEEYKPDLEHYSPTVIATVMLDGPEKIVRQTIDRMATVFRFDKNRHFITWERFEYVDIDKDFHIIDVFTDKSQLKNMKRLLTPNSVNPITYLERICVTLPVEPSKPIKSSIVSVKDEDLFETVTDMISVMPKERLPVVIFHDTGISRVYGIMQLINAHFDAPGNAFYEFEHPFKRSLGNVVLKVEINPGWCSYSQLAVSGYIPEQDKTIHVNDVDY